MLTYLLFYFAFAVFLGLSKYSCCSCFKMATCMRVPVSRLLWQLLQRRRFLIALNSPVEVREYSSALSSHGANAGRNRVATSRDNKLPQSGRFKRESAAPRTERMTENQDWSNVYPTAASFKPSVVPLPVRMGYPVERGVPPDKKGNLELIKVKLSSLNLDDHARKKLIKLVGERYCKDTDTLTIRTDRCPLRRQNYDYGMYLLTVLYHESWKTENWESEKTEADMEEYIWENSVSEKTLLETLRQMKTSEGATDINREELIDSALVKDYKNSVESLKNEGETEDNISLYKESVKKLLNLSAFP
ncbi:small ribosomal subunit protein mS35 isoform X3 [Microcaecilia unicolor]|uniref:28S ribosomal protein S35, mitochondrial isoform X3 n=1 Tax=Microcaecilia unicolor TaxID=1415580 RepID=A0A6P7Z030_9AMPH|nr:28S ribosomal protein S35, mitochondrial isoform X3 [Microcaecilia unicolor]